MKKPIEKILQALEGLNTIDLVAKKLHIKKTTAIKKVHELRKLGYVKTSGGGKQPRIYRISRTKLVELGNPGLYEVINKNSPIKLVQPYIHRFFNKKLSIEEAIVRAVQSRDFRLILASLALFNKIRNWHDLYQLAKKANIRRKLGALYDTARETIKVRKMDDKTQKLLLQAKNESRYIIQGLKSKDFRAIEKKWKVYIPFNIADLERYKA